MTANDQARPTTPADLQDRPLRIAVIGTGGMGGAHVAGMAAIPDAQVTWVVDIALEKAEALAATTGARPTASMDEALADPAVDAVLIALPTSLHRMATEAAARAGKHVFCEKPIARNAADGEAMVAACREAGVTLMIGHVVRFFPEYQRVKEMLDRGDLGRIATIRATRTNPPVQERSPWFADVEKNGGVVLDLMVHELDNLCWLFGDIERLYAHGLTYTKWQPKRDYAAASLKFRSGAIAHVESSWSHSNHRTAFEITGQHGMVRFDSERSATLVLERNVALTENLDRPARIYARPGVLGPHQREVVAWVKALRTGEPVPVSGEDGVRAITLANAVLDSMRTSQPISFAEGTIAAD